MQATHLSELTLTERDVTLLYLCDLQTFVRINNRCYGVALCIPLYSFLTMSMATVTTLWPLKNRSAVWMINFHFANIFSFVTDGALKSPAGNLGVAIATSHHCTK